MGYKAVDLGSWPRREFFRHYMSAVPCTYSMTVRLDITNILDSGTKLYPAMLYLLTKEVDRWEQFRMALRPGGELVLYDHMEPSYTVFHHDDETFSNLWTECSGDYPAFLRAYERDTAEFGGVHGFAPKPGMPENCFTVSMLPWAEFEGFNLNTAGFGYLIPIFTMGRFRRENGRASLPLAVQVHHAVCDGFHVCRFIDGLQAAADGFCP